MKPKVIFFSRAYQTKLFPLLRSEKYESVYVTLTKGESDYLVSKGLDVEFCFETYTPKETLVDNNYLQTSLVSDRFLNKFPLEKRKEILSKEVSFWQEIFEKYKPIAVLNEQVAIEIAEVMYLEAKKRDIVYLAWMNNPINGYFYWIEDPIKLSLTEEFLNIKVSDENYKIVDDYLRRIIDKNEKPYYLEPYLGIGKIGALYSASKAILKNYFARFISSKNAYEDYSVIVRNQFSRAINSFFRKYDKLEDLKDREIVLFPLHYEPESSLSYLSEFFSNQVALIENITKCLKLNQILVIKEHPAQSGMLLTEKYRLLKKNNSQVLFLPASVSSFSIIKKSKLIITLTSHLGWEAIILGKPVYLLGKMFYDRYPYVNTFTSFEKLRQEIRDETYKLPDMLATREFIGKILERSHKGFPFPCKLLYEKGNISDIIKAIEYELIKFKKDKL